jgi:hypothetical protein
MASELIDNKSLNGEFAGMTVNVCWNCDEPVMPNHGWKTVPYMEDGLIKAALAHYDCTKAMNNFKRFTQGEK